MATSTTTSLPVGGTEQQSLITVVVGGTSLGTFDTRDGGEPSAKVAKHRPGGMGPEVPYAALPSYSDMTVSRVDQWDRDGALIKSLVPSVGTVTMSVTEQPLDATGTAYGASTTWSGGFSSLKFGKADSTSDAVRTWEIGMTAVQVA